MVSALRFSGALAPTRLALRACSPALAASVALFTACSDAPTRPQVVGPWLALEPGPYESGRSYYGRNRYIEFRPGDLNIVISAPHGGPLRPTEIPDRTWGIRVNDSYTLTLAAKLEQQFLVRTGQRPSFVLNKLHRIKLDANRDLREAAQGHRYAEIAWAEYHAALDTAISRCERRHGHCWLVDLHGHGHPEARIELGYSFPRLALDTLSDAEIDRATSLLAGSTMRTILTGGPERPSTILRGTTSLGALFTAAGYRTVPSPSEPRPLTQYYFDGVPPRGYTIGRHGCRDRGATCAILLELPYPGIRDSDANRTRFAQRAAGVLLNYARRYVGDPTGSAP